MKFIKIFFGTILVYAITNLIFGVVFISTGGIPGTSIGSFFGDYASNDWGGFIAFIFQPSGTQGDFFSSLYYFIAGMNASTPNGLSKGANILGVFWVLLPGIITAAVSGFKFSEGEVKMAYFGTLAGILFCNLIPMIIGAAGLLDTALPPPTLTQTGIIPIVYINNVNYLAALLIGIVNGAIWGGTSAWISSSAI